jgi:uncharacterized lipoprotein YajG
MRTRLALLAALTLLAACSAPPTAPSADGVAPNAQYVGPGSSGDQGKP